MRNLRLILFFLSVLVMNVGCGGIATSRLPDTSELEEAPGFNIRAFALEIGPNGGAIRYQACYVPDYLEVPDDVTVPQSDWVCTEIQQPEIAIGFAWAMLPEVCGDDPFSDECAYWISLIPDEELQP